VRIEAGRRVARLRGPIAVGIFQGTHAMPAHSRQQDFLLGVVVLGFVGLLLVSVIFIYPRLGEPTRQVVVRFEHDKGVAPLKEGSPVLLAGSIQVGKVTAVRHKLVRDPSRSDGEQELMIVARIRIARSVPLYRDCRITTDQPPVGGGGVVVIMNVGTPEAGPLPEGAAVRGLPPRSLAFAIGTFMDALTGEQGLLRQARQLLDPQDRTSLVYRLLSSLDDLNAITQSIRMEVDPDEQQALLAKVHVILDHFAETTAAIRDEMRAANDAGTVARLHNVLERLDEGLTEAREMLRENRPALRDTLASVAHTTETVDTELMQRLRAELDRDNPDSMLGKLHAAMDRVNTSLEDLRAITADSRRAVTSGRHSLEQIMANVKDTSAQLKLAAAEIRSAPWRLFYRPGAREREQMTVFDAARSFAEAAIHLDDAAARLQIVLDLSGQTPMDERGREEIRQALESLQTAFERFERAEGFLWDQMK